MYLTNKDKTLFRILNNFGEKGLESQIQKSSEAFQKLKEQPEFFVIFGYYNTKSSEFIWQNNMNNITAKFIKDNYMYIFGTDKTLNKLFQPVVQLRHKYKNIIPYLMEIGNALCTVVRFTSKDFEVYALTNISGVKDDFNLEPLNDAICLYRKLNELGFKNHSKAKQRKDSIVFECKEKLG